MERARRESGRETLNSPDENGEIKRKRKYPSLLPHENREFFFMDDDPASYPVPDPDEVYYRPLNYDGNHEVSRKRARIREIELRNEKTAREYEEELLNEKGCSLFHDTEPEFTSRGMIRSDNIWISPRNLIIYSICSGCGKEITRKNTTYCPRCGRPVERYKRKG